jgi:HEPN domain-containing protein
MNDLEHAKLLLSMARKDLKALEGMQDARIFEDEIFGFHAQQAAEKALKSWLSAIERVRAMTVYRPPR